MKANNYNVKIEITTTYNEETFEEKHILRIKDYSVFLTGDITIYKKQLSNNFLTLNEPFYKTEGDTTIKYTLLKITSVTTTCNRHANAVVSTYTCRINEERV